MCYYDPTVQQSTRGTGTKPQRFICQDKASGLCNEAIARYLAATTLEGKEYATCPEQDPNSMRDSYVIIPALCPFHWVADQKEKARMKELAARQAVIDIRIAAERVAEERAERERVAKEKEVQEQKQMSREQGKGSRLISRLGFGKKAGK